MLTFKVNASRAAPDGVFFFPPRDRTFVHVLKVLVELLLSGSLVVFLLHHVSPVVDVVTNGHLLHAALGVFDRSPSLLDLLTMTNVGTSGGGGVRHGGVWRTQA